MNASSLLLLFVSCIVLLSSFTFASLQPHEIIQPDTIELTEHARSSLDALHTAYNGELTYRVHPSTGLVDHLIIHPRGREHYTRARRFNTRATADQTPDAKFRAWLSGNGGAVGFSSGTAEADQITAQDLLLVNQNADNVTGLVHLTYEQSYNGVPIFGGRINAHFDDNGEIGAVNGVLLPPSLVPNNGTQVVDASMAESVVRARLAKDFSDQLIELSANATYEDQQNVFTLFEEPHLEYFRIGLLAGVPGDTVLCWVVRLQSIRVDYVAYVNVESGFIVELLSQRNPAAYRIIQSSNADKSFTTRWTEGQARTGVVDIDNVIDPTAQIYNLIASITNGQYLSFTGAGTQMLSRVDTANVYMSCPNAYFDGQYTNYCPGVTADDVVAHEWGHGYTQYTSGLVYQFQQGAMNEAWSDIWGEMVDQMNGQGRDSPQAYRTDYGANQCVDWRVNCRWKLAEDSTAFGGPIRDMWSPNCYGNPGAVLDGYYKCYTSSQDSGGVHTNSGVVNRMFALLSDGATFNGVTVAPIGTQKAMHLFWQTQRYYLTSVSNFANLPSALTSACNDLIGKSLPTPSVTATTWPTATLGTTVTAQDCAQIAPAAAITQLGSAAPCNYQYVFNPVTAPQCSASGTNVASFFSEDFEGANTLAQRGWTLQSVGRYSVWNNRNWVQQANTFGKSGNGIFAIDSTNLGDCGNNNQAGAMYITSKSITVPAGVTKPLLSFNHYFSTEYNYDGGIVFISVNGGSRTVIPKTAFTYNGYTYTMATSSTNTNPFANTAAFVGGYIASAGPEGVWSNSIVDLSTFIKAGDTFTISFGMTSDGCGGSYGWLIDDVNVYQCASTVNPCASNPCLNSGTCTASATSFTCACTSSWTGSTCATPVNTYSWAIVSDYGTCSSSCGTGSQTRTVQCRNQNGVNSPGMCSGVAPASSQPCNTQACVTYSWVPSATWSQCSLNCGGGTQTRVVTCISSAGAVSPGQCTGAQPASVQPCNQAACVTYNWNAGGFGSCSVSCGTGTQTQTVTCVSSATNQPVDGSFCNAGTKPATTQPCTQPACNTYSWAIVSDYGTCSSSCGTGSQTRTVQCRNQNGVNSPGMCSGVAPASSQPCNTQACVTYYWDSSAQWGQCSSTCGTGSQTRAVVCRDSNNAVASSPSLCSGSAPQSTRSCNTQACPPTVTYGWRQGDWGACSQSVCGGGFQTRSVTCYGSDGNPASVINCGATNQPESQRLCNTQACETYHWAPATEYGTCSRTCGTGVQTRTVVCLNSANTQVDASNCASLTPLATQQNCNTQACASTATYSWQLASDWTACSAACGGGTQTRRYNCVSSTGAAVITSYCTSPMPATTQRCNTQACAPYIYRYTAWSTCTKQCGSGLQTRTAYCSAYTTGVRVSNLYCGTQQPQATVQACNTSPCSTNAAATYSWQVLSDWTLCSASCNSGTQTRTIACFASTGGEVDNAQCTETQPTSVQLCNTQQCSSNGFAYQITPTGVCTATCGGGLQTVSALCYNAPYYYAASYCGGNPPTTQPCNTQACADGTSGTTTTSTPTATTYRWQYNGVYGDCTATCGGGIQAQGAVCVDSNGVQALNSRCGIARAPVRACNTQAC